MIGVMSGWVLGEWRETIGLPMVYFLERGTFIDCRGPVTIHKDSSWGWLINVFSVSHEIENGRWGPVVDRPVTVDEWAWIGSGATLYNCHVGHHAIVAVGTVVRSQEVAPWTMAAGNPARVVARFEDGKWKYDTFERYQVLV